MIGCIISHWYGVVWTALLVFAFTVPAHGGSLCNQMVLAVGERARSFKAVARYLPPLGSSLGPFVAFTAAQVWNDSEREWPMMAQHTATPGLPKTHSMPAGNDSEFNLVKWSCLIVQAICGLLAIGMAHSDNQLASTITMGIFATGVAASILLILSHDRTFTG